MFAHTISKQFLDFLGRHHIAKKIDSDVDAFFYANKMFLDAAIKGVQAAYGSFDAYLEQALNCDAAKQEHLRQTYLTTPQAYQKLNTPIDSSANQPVGQ